MEFKALILSGLCCARGAWAGEAAQDPDQRSDIGAAQVGAEEGQLRHSVSGHRSPGRPAVLVSTAAACMPWTAARREARQHASAAEIRAPQDPALLNSRLSCVNDVDAGR